MSDRACSESSNSHNVYYISDGLCFLIGNQIQHFQGYFVFFDNFYTSPALLKSLKELGLGATGTLRANRRGIPESVLVLKQALGRADVPRGTGYYIRVEDDVYVCWRDKKAVLVMSNNYPGNSDG